MHGGGNRIYGRHMITHNGQFAECKVLENFQRLCGPRTRTTNFGLSFLPANEVADAFYWWHHARCTGV